MRSKLLTLFILFSKRPLHALRKRFLSEILYISNLSSSFNTKHTCVHLNGSMLFSITAFRLSILRKSEKPFIIFSTTFFFQNYEMRNGRGKKFWCHTLGRYLKTLELGESGRIKKNVIFLTNLLEQWPLRYREGRKGLPNPF